MNLNKFYFLSKAPKGAFSFCKIFKSLYSRGDFKIKYFAMNKKITTALISVFDKNGLEPILALLSKLQVTIYSTGGTKEYIEKLGHVVTSVEEVTGYPSILGGRVKTLHPKLFGGILANRNEESHKKDIEKYDIPLIDLVIVDLYPFEKTVASKATDEEIIEKIDVGGPSMIRAAAKNHSNIVVVGDKDDYALLEHILQSQNGETSLLQRRSFAQKAFQTTAHYERQIEAYFNR